MGNAFLEDVTDLPLTRAPAQSYFQSVGNSIKSKVTRRPSMESGARRVTWSDRFREDSERDSMKAASSVNSAPGWDGERARPTNSWEKSAAMHSSGHNLPTREMPNRR